MEKRISFRVDDALERAIEEIRDYIGTNFPYKTVTKTDAIVYCIYYQYERIKQND